MARRRILKINEILSLATVAVSPSLAFESRSPFTGLLRIADQFNSRQLFSTRDDFVVRDDEVMAVSKPPNDSPQVQGMSLTAFQTKIGLIEQRRYSFPEYNSGEVPRLFSAIEYVQDNNNQVTAKHATGSVWGAAALVAGTTVGAGVLALPTATAASGFIPSSIALTVAWIYMTISGLLIAELSLNRMYETAKPGLGLLDLYHSSLGRTGGAVGSMAYFFNHYAIMVAYLAQGGSNIDSLLTMMFGFPVLPSGGGQLLFALICGGALYAAKESHVEQFNNLFVVGVAASFLSIVAIGAQTADFALLLNPVNQHADQVMSCLPILFLALVYQNIVPTIVTQLEGDRTKITKSIVAGTAAPLLMFLAWNAVILGNVVGSDLTGVDPVSLLQSGSAGSGLLGPLVGSFSFLAIVTSVIGFTYGMVSSWADVFQVDSRSESFDRYKGALFALTFVPPLYMSVANPDVFYSALENGGAYGVSTLFLILPPLMAWKERYGDHLRPLVTKPMVPFGKLPLALMWTAAAVLIMEQTIEKLGIVSYIKENVFHTLN